MFNVFMFNANGFSFRKKEVVLADATGKEFM